MGASRTVLPISQKECSKLEKVQRRAAQTIRGMEQ